MHLRVTDHSYFLCYMVFILCHFYCLLVLTVRILTRYVEVM